ncbi:hypothetical protein EMN47_14925 [Prolixibacteraceae bacterium JC049]|nr:hypothetical protein [Prolixibacteraceae bacterium JC049]
MTERKIAVIDLGTNTCNLGIGTKCNGELKVEWSERYPVRLAEGGINDKRITSAAMKRACNAINHYKQIIEEHNAELEVAYATSAVRNATNQAEFIRFIEENTGVKLSVIDGNREAKLIFQGVTQAVQPITEPVLILDIGGGSNEFILTDRNGIIWKQSFEIGIARIHETFHPEIPVNEEMIVKIEAYFQQFLDPLWEILSEYPVKTLVGCAGAFDAFADLMNNCTPETTFRSRTALNLLDYTNLHKMLIENHEQVQMLQKGTDPVRQKMIVYASIFVNFVINCAGIEQIVQTGYSLKEGAMAEIFGLV